MPPPSHRMTSHTPGLTWGRSPTERAIYEAEANNKQWVPKDPNERLYLRAPKIVSPRCIPGLELENPELSRQLEQVELEKKFRHF